MNPGRIFRKIGLPFWTLVGVGVSAILFAYLGALLERLLRLWLGVDESTQHWWPFLPQLIIFAIPFAVVGLIWWIPKMRHRMTQIPTDSAPDVNALRQPDRKKGIILLVSNAAAAMFAIEYHFNCGPLKQVWLIPSNDKEQEKFGGSTLKIAAEIKRQCKTLADGANRSLKVEIKEDGVSPADSQDTFDYVRKIFRDYRYQPDELIADFTSGTKPMSVGMIMACLPIDRALEYVSLNKETGSHGPFLIDYQHRAFDLIG